TGGIRNAGRRLHPMSSDGRRGRSAAILLPATLEAEPRDRRSQQSRGSGERRSYQDTPDRGMQPRSGALGASTSQSQVSAPLEGLVVPVVIATIPILDMRSVIAIVVPAVIAMIAVIAVGAIAVAIVVCRAAAEHGKQHKTSEETLGPHSRPPHGEYV